MREKEGDEAAIEEFFRRRRGERCEHTEYESDVLGHKTARGWLDLTKLYWSRCGSYPGHTKLELCELYVLSQSPFRIAPLSLTLLFSSITRFKGFMMALRPNAAHLACIYWRRCTKRGQRRRRRRWTMPQERALWKKADPAAARTLLTMTDCSDVRLRTYQLV